MFIRTARFFAYRNLAEVRLELEDGFNVFAGRNGQGKTNLLEGLYLLAMPRSFRAGRFADWVMTGAEQGAVQCTLATGHGDLALALQLEGGRRSWFLDDQRVAGVAEIAAHLKIVFFGPEDLKLIKGGPEERRRFLDRAAYREDPAHLERVQVYRELLSQRNTLLREFGIGRLPAGLLESYEEQLIRRGAELTATRARLAADLGAEIAGYWAGVQAVSGGSVTLRYRSGYGFEPEGMDAGTLLAATEESLARARAEDMARAGTSVGPHLDDLEIRFDDHPARVHASQGQIRSLAAALRMGELILWRRRQGEAPILMMDDLSSELDRDHYRVIMEGVRAHAGQVILTTTTPKYVLQNTEAALFHVYEGRVERDATEEA
ncbi:MAG: DNA replication and repair protein RecF [Pseudomonadota bacterium]